ncbi:MAG: polyketide synthase dehydratase domain-containing protein, partial [Blastocatellia bacterium]
LEEEERPDVRRRSDYEGHMTFGSRWTKLLKHVHVGEGEWLAYLELPEKFESDLALFKLHPSLMDAAVGVVQLAGEGAYLPFGYDKLKATRPLTPRIYSHVRHNRESSKSGFLTCDVTIMDDYGLELVEIEGYMLRKVDGTAAQVLSEFEGAGAERRAAESRPKAPAQNPNDGMTPREGVEVFSRALSLRLEQPQLITSTKEIHAAMEFVRAFTRERVMQDLGKLRTPGVKHPRPNLQNPYVAPRNELESKLVEIWQDILGLDQVGCFDNFFELGGESLLATQLISRLDDAFQIELPLRVIFEAPTAADLAVAVVRKQAEQTDAGTLAAILADLRESEGDEKENAYA